MFTPIIQFAHQSPFLFSLLMLGVYMIFNAFVAGMPAPKPTSSVAYEWTYNSLHALAFNLDKVVAAKFPQLAPGQTLASTTATTGADGSKTNATVVATGAPTTMGDK